MHESSYANANQTDDVSAAVPMHSTEILPRTKEGTLWNPYLFEITTFSTDKNQSVMAQEEDVFILEKNHPEDINIEINTTDSLEIGESEHVTVEPKEEAKVEPKDEPKEDLQGILYNNGRNMLKNLPLKLPNILGQASTSNNSYSLNVFNVTDDHDIDTASDGSLSELSCDEDGHEDHEAKNKRKEKELEENFLFDTFKGKDPSTVAKFIVKGEKIDRKLEEIKKTDEYYKFEDGGYIGSDDDFDGDHEREDYPNYIQHCLAPNILDYDNNVLNEYGIKHGILNELPGYEYMLRAANKRVLTGLPVANPDDKRDLFNKVQDERYVLIEAYRWLSVKYGMPRRFMNGFMTAATTNVRGFPKDVRTITRHRYKVKYYPLDDKTNCCDLPVEKLVEDMFSEYRRMGWKIPPLQKVIFNADGIAAAKSSKRNLYVFLIAFPDLKYKPVIMCHVLDNTPKNQGYYKSTIEYLNKIHREGIKGVLPDNNVIHVSVYGGFFDRKALSEVCWVQPHNSLQGCPHCRIVGNLNLLFPSYFDTIKK